MDKRYVPPHERRRLFKPNDIGKERASLDERFSDETKPLNVVVTLKSGTKHQDLPGEVVNEEETDLRESPSHLICQKFKTDFQQTKLRELMRWFRNIGRDDHKAVLAFPASLDKDQRKQIHHLANNFGLSTSSQGFGDKRYISVYTVEMATLGVGKISLTEDEKRKSEEVWYLVKKFGGQYSKYSHNEISEMIIADNLDPTLQELLDENQDILAQEFEKKCQIDTEQNRKDNKTLPFF